MVADLFRSSGETSEDLAHGQIVIVTARWILVLSGLLIALWNPGSISELRVQIIVVFVLAVLNFYLHAQILTRRPALDSVVYLASLGDLAVITAIVASQGGYASNVFIFYFPAVLAFSVSFPRGIAALYTAGTLLLYGLIAVISGGASQTIITRLLMIAAVATCSNLYWRIEQRRRHAASEAQESLMTQIHQRSVRA